MTRLAVPSAIYYLVTGERKRSFVKHQAECSRCRKTGARTVRKAHSPKCLRASALGLTRSVANTCERYGSGIALGATGIDYGRVPLCGQGNGDRPVREKPHAGKYGELTPLRQRGGRGYDLSLTHWPAFTNHRSISLMLLPVYGILAY